MSKSPRPALLARTGKRTELADAIRTWWASESDSWDAEIQEAGPTGGTDLWDGMPTVDSKSVARMSPIFERILGVPLDINLIRPGGYESIEDVISDLLPKMERQARARTAPNRKEAGK